MAMNRMVLPFVDASRIDSDAERDHIIAVLERVLPVAEETGIELHLETSLSPSRFADLLARLPHPMLKVNYDSGNSASLGYHPRDEFAAYGERVGSVHIKDRVRGGGTVPLMTGDTDFETLFECLRKVGYDRDFVLQVARGTAGDEVSWARANRAFVLERLARSR
jgi:L-ribulose-5-phosphate 3-epimerase